MGWRIARIGERESESEEDGEGRMERVQGSEESSSTREGRKGESKGKIVRENGRPQRERESGERGRMRLRLSEPASLERMDANDANERNGRDRGVLSA